MGSQTDENQNSVPKVQDMPVTPNQLPSYQFSQASPQIETTPMNIINHGDKVRHVEPPIHRGSSYLQSPNIGSNSA